MKIVSPGTSLRIAASEASRSNPLVTPPLLACPSWLAGTSYVTGNVVQTNGLLYECGTPGTSTAAGAPTGEGPAPFVDGSIAWWFVGPAYASAPDAPQWSENGTQPLAGLDNVYPVYGSSNFTIQGAFAEKPYSSAAFYNSIGSATAPGNMSGSSTTRFQGYDLYKVRICFSTDAQQFQIHHSGSTAYRILVNGEYLSRSGAVQNAAGAGGYSVVTFSNRRDRQIVIEAAGNSSITSVSVDADSTIEATSIDPINVAFVGDSFASAEGPGLPPLIAGEIIPCLVGLRLGWTVWPLAQGGTGYINPGPNNEYYTFGERGQSLAPINPDVVVFYGGQNDRPYPLSAITSAALAAFRSARATCPSAVVIVTGTNYGSTGPDTTTLAVESAIYAAFQQFGDKNSYFVPIATDKTGPWITGTGTVYAPNGTGNADFIVNQDKTHPVPGAGITFWANRLSQAFSRIIRMVP